MNNENSQIISALESISEDAKKTFGNLFGEQINWKPSAEGWSVGQCFDHLIKSNELFFDDLGKIANGTRRSSFYERFSPLSGFFGKLIADTLKKDKRKIKAPTPKIIPPSEVEANVIESFAAHQKEFIKRIKSVETANWQKIKVTSGLMKVITYSLADNFQIIVEHERRHFRQAERVLKAENFPK